MSADTIERRFLIKSPLHWFAEAKIRSVTRIDVTQTYFEHFEQPSTRISKHHIHKKDGSKKIEYVLGTKRILGSQTEYSDEYIISESYFQQRMATSKKWKLPINKKKYYISFNHRIFSLNVYGDYLRGLTIMSVNLSHSNVLIKDIVLPPYLDIVKEITKDNRYLETELTSVTSETLRSLLE